MIMRDATKSPNFIGGRASQLSFYIFVNMHNTESTVVVVVDRVGKQQRENGQRETSSTAWSSVGHRCSRQLT